MKNSRSTTEIKSPESSREDSGFRKEFFHDLYSLEAANFWFRNRNRLIVWALKTFFPKADSLLEIGCGTGFVLSGIKAAIPGLRIFGSELFEEGLEFARKRIPDANLIQLDAREMSFSEAFDVIGAFDVIEHIEEDQLVLRQLYQACRQGIILTVPQHKWLWSAIDEHSCHKRRYKRSELVEKVEDAGFQVTAITSFVCLLLPILFLSRLSKKASEEIDVTRELKLPPALDWLLDKVLQCEYFLIRNSLYMPAGGSLLLVAKKLQQAHADQ